ncbi:TolC family protein [Planctomycetota bacterium]
MSRHETKPQLFHRLDRARSTTLLLVTLCVVAGCASAAQSNARLAHDQVAAQTAWGEGDRRGQAELPDLHRQDLAVSDLIVYASVRNAGLEAAFHQWRAALERATGAASLPDPTASYSYFVREVETRVGPQRHRVGLRQTIPWPTRLARRGDEAVAQARVAEARFRSLLQEIQHKVTEIWCELYYVRRAIRFTRESMQLLTHLERVARTRYKAAAGGHHDVIRAQVELGRLEDRLSSLQELMGPMRARLNAHLSRTPGAFLPWPTALPDTDPMVQDSAVLKSLVRHNPELSELRHRLAATRAHVQAAEYAYVPDLTIGLDYTETGGPVRELRTTRDAGKDAIVASVMFNLPFLTGRRRAEVAAARAEQRAAGRSLHQRRLGLLADGKLALYRLHDAERKIALFRDTLIPKGTEALKASETAFIAGRTRFLDIVDAQRTLLELQLSLERSLVDRAQRAAHVERLMGSGPGGLSSARNAGSTGSELPHRPRSPGDRPARLETRR